MNMYIANNNKKMTKQTLHDLRPRLSKVAPLTFWICVGFSLVNVAIWFLMYHIPVTAIKSNPVPVVGEQFFTFSQWGFWYLFLGVAMLFGLWRNNWTLIKQMLSLGLMSKLVWAYALLYMISHGYPVFATFILWAFLAWVQAWTIIHFVPTIGDERHTLPENERYR